MFNISSTKSREEVQDGIQDKGTQGEETALPGRAS